MTEYLLFILCISHAILIYIADIKYISRKFSSRIVYMAVYYLFIFCIYCAIAVDIAQQPYFHILRHILRTHRDGILSRDVVVLHHLHGVGTGGNAFDGILSGIALNENLIVCFGESLGNQLKNDVIGIAAKAGGRAGNGVSNNRDVLPNCGYGSVSSNGNLDRKSVV